ncbi:MAG: ATP-dependent RecD-like DNA helicase [Lachnospiraceae bacterium]|nr:ATP-dependent RecD-like DNA helicase [Lachnospiraceae bacterium]
MEQIKGYVEHIIFRNSENGYTVLNLVCDGEEITCVGMLKTIDQGETIEAEGDYIEHAAYGRQFKINAYKIVAPDDLESMERYLGSGAIKGIGIALAGRIIRRFGEDTFRIIEEEPERLAEVKGISERKAREIACQMEEKKDMREAMIFLQKYGISNTLAVKIYDTYNARLYGILQENPYQLAEDIAGIGFKMADEIASKIGIHTDSDFRIRSGILYTLLQGSLEGHVYLPEELLLTRAALLLELQEEAIQSQLANLMMDKKIVIKEKNGHRNVYSMSYYYEELNCASMLESLNVCELWENEAEQEKVVRRKIEHLEKQLDIELDELQRHAVLESVKNGIVILSGGPGTGKTTTINAMIRYFEEEGMDIYLAAPTGRAAKRMTETTGYEAKTIHRLLELNGAVDDEKRGASFERNAENPLEADVIIIDEMSMVDIHLFQSLLKALVPGTRLIMVGDVNQLPSVGAGQVLKDLIDSRNFPVVMLQKIFRQAGESDIVVNAHRIHRGEQISLENKSKDFFFLERGYPEVIYKHMIQLIQDKLPKYVNADKYDIQVLTPMRKGPLGVESLNRILQQYLNPANPSKKEHAYGENLFRQGDKVMQIKNNYQLEWEIVSRYGIPIDKGLGVFNGDMGTIREINDYAQTVVVEYDEHKQVTYAYGQLDELELAYAITIHKSQGSEYPAVIMPLLAGPKMLFNRNLLYTGVTRAKQCVTILGSSETVREMIANESEQKRFTGLCDRIREVAGYHDAS